MNTTEFKYFMSLIGLIAVCVFTYYGTTDYNATKAGLEQCPKYGAGTGGDSIWVKSCTEYTALIENKKESK